jgi:hypothetical protein
MVDYTTRSSGVSAKGILVTLAVIVGIFAVLAVLGTSSVPTDSGDTIAPAAEETAPAAPAVTE